MLQISKFVNLEYTIYFCSVGLQPIDFKILTNVSFKLRAILPTVVCHQEEFEICAILPTVDFSLGEIRQRLFSTSD